MVEFTYRVVAGTPAMISTLGGIILERLPPVVGHHGA
jgi:hypothetical protein